MPIPSCCTFTRLWRRRSGGLLPRGPRPHWPQRRPPEQALGNPRNLHHAGSLGRAALIQAADEFASGLVPLVQAIRAAGALTHAFMALELNRRGIRSARGGMASSVANLIGRTNS